MGLFKYLKEKFKGKKEQEEIREKEAVSRAPDRSPGQ